MLICSTLTKALLVEVVTAVQKVSTDPDTTVGSHTKFNKHSLLFISHLLLASTFFLFLSWSHFLT